MLFLRSTTGKIVASMAWSMPVYVGKCLATNVSLDAKTHSNAKSSSVLRFFWCAAQIWLLVVRFECMYNPTA